MGVKPEWTLKNWSRFGNMRQEFLCEQEHEQKGSEARKTFGVFMGQRVFLDRLRVYVGEHWETMLDM